MKTVYRQDGSEVELTDEDAAKWLKRGLATEKNPGKPVAPEWSKTSVSLPAENPKSTLGDKS